ncbi:hypothetical protein [Caenispirillum bisanense]|uniref:Beta-barrel assembly machine subunit BamF n=1 Tax=Caenispirillum bisanense TaxID=414052 RepID=A0A286G2U6_9PROT|nr:hypothetical protein [Caenispirillum bisanense]SOD89870.1 hypothetical protein SAMN05421508_101363 [Caenispirillum bisanense]
MIRLPLLMLPAAVLALSACVAGGPPVEDQRTVAVPDGRYDYLQGEVPYDTPAMTETEAELVEKAGRVPAEPRRDSDEASGDRALGDLDEELFDR